MCLDEIAPIKTINTRKSGSAPWYDDERVRCGLNRDRLYHQYMRIKSEENKIAYKRIRNKFRSLTRKKKANYFKEFVSNCTTSCSRLWKRINPFINPNKKTLLNPSLLVSGNPHFTMQDVVNAFANYFSSILKNFVFYSLSNCLTYIDKHLHSNQLTVDKLNGVNLFEFTEITPDRVSHTLSSIDKVSSPGFVNIDSRVFKSCNTHI